MRRENILSAEEKKNAQTYRILKIVARILDQEFTIEASLTTNPLSKLESPTKLVEWQIVEEQQWEINTWPAVALEG